MKPKLILGLALFPFKAYVILALPFYFLLRLIYPHPFATNVGNNTYVTDPLFEELLRAFVLCAPVLLIGAVIQFIVGDSKAGTRTILFTAPPTLVLAALLFLWVIAHLL